MAKNIFEFRDYKQFLNDLAAASGRGFKKVLAESALCQTTYISQVLGGSAHLSLEQAQSACSFLGLNPDESYYLLLLVERARAGTASLAQFLDEKIRLEQEKHLLIRDRVKLGTPLNHEAKAQYYSSWHYAAVHMALTIPRFQTPTEIAKKFQLPLTRVNDILQFLISVGLAVKKEEKFCAGESQIYLEKASLLISKHHSNWRMRAIHSLDQDRASEIHFSSVFTLTEEAAQTIRSIIVQAIEDSINVVKDAKEEKLVAMTLDFFDL